MKNKEVFENHQNLVMIDTEGLTGVKLSHRMITNIKTLQEAGKTLQESLKYPETYTEYKEKATSIFNDHSEKNEEGNPKLNKENQPYITAKNVNAYKKDIKALEEENQELIDEVKKIEDAYAKFLEEEAELTTPLLKVSLEDLPESISPIQMTALSFMIEDF